MYSKISILRTALLLVILGAMTIVTNSCDYKPLCYGTSQSVKVVFDWKLSPSADVNTMNLWLFPVEGGKPLYYQFAGKEGGFIKVKQGRYQVIATNGDSESLRMNQSESYSKFYITTRLSSQLEPLGRAGAVEGANPEGQPAYLAPDALWTAIGTMEVKNIKGEQIFTYYPEDRLCNYSIEVRNGKHLENVSSVSATISGLSSGYYPALNELDKKLTMLPFAAYIQNGTIWGKTKSFGNALSLKANHRLVIYLIMSDGSKWLCPFDVTDQVNNAQDQRNVHIIIDQIDIPKPIDDGSGFVPSVDDWDEINVDISM